MYEQFLGYLLTAVAWIIGVTAVSLFVASVGIIIAWVMML